MMFEKAKLEALQDIEQKTLPKFLISDTYNQVDVPIAGEVTDSSAEYKLDDITGT